VSAVHTWNRRWLSLHAATGFERGSNGSETLTDESTDKGCAYLNAIFHVDLAVTDCSLGDGKDAIVTNTKLCDCAFKNAGGFCFRGAESRNPPAKHWIPVPLAVSVKNRGFHS
jgi:hypothetical protein